MSERVILHCDCNSFFASVEAALEPRYKNVPMAVCGSQEARHGIVLAKNEAAKAYGIQTAETVVSAKRKCPSLTVVSPHYAAYKEYSVRANEIYSRFTDMIEPFGIDESWLDVTASQKIFGTGYEIAEKIRRTVKEELGITVSIGVSFNKVFAKLGSDYKKPDAITVIDKSNFKEIIYPLHVSSLLFIGKKTAEELCKLGIRTVGELAKATPEMLMLRFGKVGETLYKYAAGLDDSPVSAVREDAKSISCGFTFKHDLLGREEWRIGIDYLCDEIGCRLRKNKVKCATVQVTIKDEYLRSIQRQRQQSPPSDIGAEIAETAFDIVNKEWSAGKPIRMITVSAASLIHADEDTSQISFFEENVSDTREKQKETEITVDKIRQRYGFDSILKGSMIDNDLGLDYGNKKQADR